MQVETTAYLLGFCHLEFEQPTYGRVSVGACEVGRRVSPSSSGDLFKRDGRPPNSSLMPTTSPETGAY